jgi:large subunit ribosomal protein L21e
MKGSRGYKTSTRHLMRKHTRSKGKVPLGRLLREYKPGDQVNIIIDSSMPKGQPHKRFHGKVGRISEKRGRAYVVLVNLGNAEKQLIVRPEHLVPHK